MNEGATRKVLAFVGKLPEQESFADSWPFAHEPPMTRFTSNPAGKHQHDQDDQYQAKAATGPIAPISAVAPGGKGAKERQDQNDNEYGH
jgi:hypothetical protein